MSFFFPHILGPASFDSPRYRSAQESRSSDTIKKFKCQHESADFVHHGLRSELSLTSAKLLNPLAPTVSCCSLTRRLTSKIPKTSGWSVSPPLDAPPQWRPALKQSTPPAAGSHFAITRQRQHLKKKVAWLIIVTLIFFLFSFFFYTHHCCLLLF